MSGRGQDDPSSRDAPKNRVAWIGTLGPEPMAEGGRVSSGGLEPPGTVIDQRYAIVREIARGGMGVVLEARHLYTGRSVALKRVLAEWAARPDVEMRLALEAELVGAVAHPNVVEILDAGIDADGTHYMVMEMLSGRSLEGLLLARGKLAVDGVVTATRGLINALACVHEAGLVHRDVKPANIFVTRERFHGQRVKLIDFGLATTRGDGQPSSPPPLPSKLPHALDVIGTPAYMAPEQMRGQSVDARADVYALGVTLYECLTGVLPRPGGVVEILSCIAAGEVPRPLRELRPETPEAFAALIDGALAVSPDARPTLNALAAGLRERDARARTPLTLLDEPEPAPRSDGPPILLWRRRHPRFAFISRARVHLDDGTVLEARTEELSRDGLQVRIPTVPVVQGSLRLEIFLPGGPVSVAGEVRWSRIATRWQVLGVALETEPTGRLATYVLELARRHRIA